MQVVDLSHDGKLNPKDIQSLGGSFNWLEIIRMRGVGSSKFIYHSGVNGFDEMKRISAASNYVTLELFKRGIAVRFQKQDRYRASIFQYAEIKEILVTSHEMRICYKGQEKIVYQAEIDVHLDFAEFKLRLFPPYYRTGIKFLKKKILKRCCSFVLSPEIIDENSMDTGWLMSIIENN